jgi:hypothetical protein
MTVSMICQVNNNQIIVTLPPEFASQKEVHVEIDDLISERDRKLEIMRKAKSDALFLSDIEEINQDFKFIDGEI